MDRGNAMSKPDVEKRLVHRVAPLRGGGKACVGRPNHSFLNSSSSAEILLAATGMYQHADLQRTFLLTEMDAPGLRLPLDTKTPQNLSR